MTIDRFEKRTQERSAAWNSRAEELTNKVDKVTRERDENWERHIEYRSMYFKLLAENQAIDSDHARALAAAQAQDGRKRQRLEGQSGTT